MNAFSSSTFSSVTDLRYGRDPILDAWLLHFMSENNIDYSIEPGKNASPEQIRFMVHLSPEQVFAPCTDEMLRLLLDQSEEPPIIEEYAKRRRIIQDLIDTYCPTDYLKQKIRTLCEHKYRQVVASPVMIPSRLMKRFNTIFLTQSGLDDPGRERRRLLNRKASNFAQGSELARVLNACPTSALMCTSLPELRFTLDMLELDRLLRVSVWKDIWLTDGFKPSYEETQAELSKPCPELEKLKELLDPYRPNKMKILYLPESSGALIFDLRIIACLLRMGHRVVLALKEGFYFDSPTFWEREDDPVLAEALESAYFLEDNKVTKNSLLKTIRENPFVVISDGTRERLNLCRTSLTFARTWKECDLILAKGELNYRRLMLTSHEFTRDAFCFYRDTKGALHASFKPKPASLRKFSEADILAKSESIIGRMRSEKLAGRNVMFYSAIVGSIPHQVDTAIKVLNTFVGYLRSKLAGTFIINPAEHFEEGMDGDDLMYMWERVQRSGLINVWRFQTYSDIETSFDLMGLTVPTIWAGKDSTYSTGCTKEMRIALDVQARQPELQIIGPDPEKFFRRREYGVGKFCDVVVEG